MTIICAHCARFDRKSIMTAFSLTPNKYQNEIVIYLLLNYHFSASQSQLSLSKMHLSLPDSCFSKHDIFQFRCYYIDVPSVMLIRFIIVHTCFSPNLCCVLLACPVIKHNYSNYSIYVSVWTYKLFATVVTDGSCWPFYIYIYTIDKFTS